MFRAQPVVNKVLNKRWNDMDQKMHETRIKLVKSSLDSRTPTSKFRHVKLNNKKGQQQEGIFSYTSYSQ